MSRLRKNFVILSTVSIATLIILTTTAVAQIHSAPVMNIITKKQLFENEIKQLTSNPNNYNLFKKQQNVILTKLLMNNNFIKALNKPQLIEIIKSNRISNFINRKEVQNYMHNEAFTQLSSSIIGRSFLNQLTILKEQPETLGPIMLFIVSILALIFGVLTWIFGFIFGLVYVLPVVWAYFLVNGLPFGFLIGLIIGLLVGVFWPIFCWWAVISGGAFAYNKITKHPSSSQK